MILLGSTLIALAILAAFVGITSLTQATSAREHLMTRAEDVAADPAILSDPLRRRSFLVRWADRYDRDPEVIKTREALRRAHVPWRPSDYQTIRVGLTAGIVAGGYFMFDIPLLPTALLGLGVYYLVPKMFFFLRQGAYVQAFDEQLTEVTQLLANSLRSGMSIQQAIAQVIDRLPEPARGEFRNTHHELMVGETLLQSFSRLRQRVPSRDLDVVIGAVVVQHQAGGNLARVLAAMSVMLTERQRIASEIRSLTADARFSAMICMIMPIGILLMLRGTLIGEAIFETVIGWVLLAIFLLIQVGVFFIIRKILQIEV
ncbi:MAG: type II secretion system protein [Chloroflexi bacterium AL-W]|nr:type II secretion system protein [Chloroflexi bacterium AL-N1]NOK69771.1 type II secretion system protein [Chloroflexi bacterium AL-N10]NOK73625.1 type II secretion system protein [Chloroflexi bacterium AL-N5]NOK83941.1 type II secretion system protein [Chloroflexi bacterium AL-W]NOK87956.1 type II secretion system protein [Chloroflexi bacterium AL-N15]